MIESLIRPHLRKFTPYSSARSEMVNTDEAAARRVYLDANELSLGSPVSIANVQLNRYPDPLQTVLRGELAGRNNVPSENLFVGVGSDEVIDLLVRLVCEPGKDNIVVVEPTYGVYRVSADLNNIRVISVQLDAEFQINADAVLAAVTPDTKIVFCCSPNNPTGNVLRKQDVIRLAQSLQCLLVVDEAYGEFADQSLLLSGREAETYENIVLLKTLSKAWGLAGIRLGYCIAAPLIVDYLLRIKPPYNINAVTSHLAADALVNERFMNEAVAIVRSERAKLATALTSSPLVARVYPSDANFILAEFNNAGSVYDALLAKGFVVRRRSEPRLRSCLRITVGTPEENKTLLHHLGELV